MVVVVVITRRFSIRSSLARENIRVVLPPAPTRLIISLEPRARASTRDGVAID